jgi:hypothetical protein
VPHGGVEGGSNGGHAWSLRGVGSAGPIPGTARRRS